MILVLIKPWGFGLDWQQLSFASLGMLEPLGIHGVPGTPGLSRRLPSQH